MRGFSEPGRDDTFWARARVLLIPAALLLAVTLPHLDQGDWLRTDSGRYAAIGLQAWRTGDLWTLQSEPGVPYFNKPPLVFWIHGWSLHVLAPGPVPARLPSVFAALGCVLITAAIAGRLAGRSAAIWSGVTLALTYEFFRRTREISLDMWQLLFVLLTVWIAVVAACASRPKSWAFLLAGVPLGLALMCKPLTALLGAPILAIWLSWRSRREGGPGAAWILLTVLGAVLVALPWHASMALLHGEDFVRQYFRAEVADRAAGRLTAAPQDSKPPWFYLAQIVAGYWPWLLLLLPALIAWWRERPGSPLWRAGSFALAWAILWLVVLSAFPDRRDRYALPVYPALSVLIGAWLGSLPTAWIARASRAGLDIAAGVAVVAAIIVGLIPLRLQAPPDPQWEQLFKWIDSQAADGQAPEVWQGALSIERGARLYLRYGTWPRTTRNRMGEFLVDRVANPPEGALLIYHERDGLTPGDNEEPMFAAGDLVVTRLGPGGWRPGGLDTPGP